MVGGMGSNDIDKICDQRRWKTVPKRKLAAGPEDNLPMATFGERVCHLPLKTIWLGMRLRTNEALIGTREGKNKLSEEQKTARCLHSQKDDVGITRSSRRTVPSSSVEHERRAQPSKRSKGSIRSRFFPQYSHAKTSRPRGPPRTDPTSETSMRDSSKRQADVGH